MSVKLVKYDAMCRAIAAAKSVDEVKKIRVQANAMAAAARVAKNKEAEADCVVIRMRATRRLDQMRQAQKATVGLAKGGGGKHSRKRVIEKPTLGSQGIDKNLAHQARILGKLSDKEFEQTVGATRDAVARAVRTVVRAADIGQQRQSYADKVKQGATVADLVALADAGEKFAVIASDPPWEFKVYSGKGKQRSAERYYDTSSLDAIKKLGEFITPLAADDCALFLWGVYPELPGALEVITAWGFEYKTMAFVWLKTTKSAGSISFDGSGLHWGMGYHTRANTEPVLLATRGNPQRMAMDIHQVVIAPVGKHSEKPDEIYTRVECLFNGPYLEVFARKPRNGWTVWGNEIEVSEAAE